MIDGASRYAVLWSVEQVTNGSFGSSLPAPFINPGGTGGSGVTGGSEN
ncbi:hypothetical protein HGO75_21485 [Mycobacterium tuberculosis]|nr:hypothetical protein [Mycobacterium tuberculosis]